MSQANAYKNLVASRKPKPGSVVDESMTVTVVPSSEPIVSIPPAVAPVSIPSVPSPPTIVPPQKKRGRPATGKRSDGAWIGRTYYVKRETDLDAEDYLLKLKRQGIEIDKSELVDFLLSAWVKWQQGENIDFLIDEFSPRQKS
jgi:hypothetical protein